MQEREKESEGQEETWKRGTWIKQCELKEGFWGVWSEWIPGPSDPRGVSHLSERCVMVE